jgi:hypothetical protein
VITYASPRLGIVKTASPTFYTAASETIDYAYVLKNTGGVSLSVTSPYTLTDDKAGSVACPAAAAGTVLDVGASLTCDTATYRLTGPDVSGASVLNTVTASGSTAPSTAPPSTSLVVPRFGCTTTTLTDGALASSGNTYTWPITNNTGLPVHVSSFTITWTLAGNTDLLVLLAGVPIGTSTSDSDESFPLIQGGPWTINTGTSTDVVLQFSGAVTSVRIVASFSEPSCEPPNPVLDSSVP